MTDDYNGDIKVITASAEEVEAGTLARRLNEFADFGNRRVVGVTSVGDTVVVVLEPSY